jgi:Cu/Ag efflux pump CusA
LKKTRLAYATVAVLVVASVVLSLFLSQSVSPLPEFQQRDIKIDLDGAPGTSRPEMDRIVGRISDELRTIPGVRNVAAHVGRAILGDQVVGINSSELWVSIDPGAHHDGTLAQIRETVDGYPGLQNDVQTYRVTLIGRQGCRKITTEPSRNPSSKSYFPWLGGL